MTDVHHPAPGDVLWTPLHSPWRWPLAAATAITAAAHLPVIGPHLHDAPYMGEEFVVLTAACLALGVASLVCDSVAVDSLTVVSYGLAMLGYVATRAVAFPRLADDVGHWLEPLGLVSVLAETVAVVAAASALSRRR